LSTQYPGYSSYSCTIPSTGGTCSAGSTTTTTTLLGTSACGVYVNQGACEDAIPWGFSSHFSYSCTNETACSSTSANPTNPIMASTSCISDNLNNATSCTSYGNSNYPSYSGFSCTSLGTTGCSGGNKKWRIDATTLITTGNTYSMNGISTTTVSSTTYSQNIYGTFTTTAAAPTGTFSAPTSAKTRYLDEWARFLHQTDVSPASGRQNASTFTIDVFKDQQDLDETSLLISTALAGGGKYFKASDENAITNALRKIFSEIQSVNSVFASSSLPVSVNTQGTYLNQVFMGMFRPEGGASPRWPGNLKQYKFKMFNGVLRLADKNGDEAISSTTGFVTPCADSFWTTDTGQYWNFGGSLALGDCSAQDSAFPSAGSTSVYSDGPDGEVVEKGGASQRLRGVYSSGGTLVSSSTNYSLCTGTDTPSIASCRMLKTCDGSSTTSCTTLTSFDTTNTAINATTLNLADASQKDNLINWTRGQDVDNENANLDGSLLPITNEMRPSVHGGVVHSQPAVVDFGGTTGTIAFYGADDGVFHAVDGGQTDTEGVELWGFVAPETYSKLNRLRTNSPPVAFPGVSGSPSPTPKEYFFDGAIGVYQKSGTVWIYPSMRRGGRSIYAFDVTDPASPVLKWRKGCFTSDTTDDSVCSTDWTGIGQTWSSPQIAYLSGYVDGSSNLKPVLIFGGGYDLCEDTNSQTRCATTPRKGANIWFVDADTGDNLRTYPTHYSVPGDLALLKDSNGIVTYVYASDTGGNVYRINVGPTDTTGTTFTSWSNNSAASQTILASLAETNHARKFINGPSVVPTADYNAVMIGSGDREHPLETDYACGSYSVTAGNYVTNQFYMLIDTPAGYPSPTVTASALVDVTSGTVTSETVSGVTTITNVTAGASSTKGWRFNFGQCEQTVNEALTIAGITYFGTNTPTSTGGTSCTADLGIARGYAVEYLTGAGASAEYVGGGMPPSPVAGVVDVDGTKVPFCIGCIDPTAANSSALQGGKVEINPTGSRYRAYWYIEND
jgi:type IV pilus assembly protein PilY1